MSELQREDSKISSRAEGNSHLQSLSETLCVKLFLPGISVVIRRLHDTNKPGWYMLILLLIMPILLIEYLFGIGLQWMAMFGIFGTLAFCVWLFQSSDECENQYGPDPTT